MLIFLLDSRVQDARGDEQDAGPPPSGRSSAPETTSWGLQDNS